MLGGVLDVVVEDGEDVEEVVPTWPFAGRMNATVANKQQTTALPLL